MSDNAACTYPRLIRRARYALACGRYLGAGRFISFSINAISLSFKPYNVYTILSTSEFTSDNLFKDIGDEYLNCIAKYENTEYNKYHRYMNRIYNYLKKYIKEIKVMQKTEGHYSIKALEYNPDLQTQEYADYKVPLLTDEVVLNISYNTNYIEDNTYDDDEYFDIEVHRIARNPTA